MLPFFILAFISAFGCSSNPFQAHRVVLRMQKCLAASMSMWALAEPTTSNFCWSTNCSAPVADDACFCEPPGWGSYRWREFRNAGVLVLSMKKSISFFFCGGGILLSSMLMQTTSVLFKKWATLRSHRGRRSDRLSSEVLRSTFWSVHIKQVGGDGWSTVASISW